MLIKYSGKYVKIYFNMKITYIYIYFAFTSPLGASLMTSVGMLFMGCCHML